MKRAKITIIGAGNVGATTAHWCAAAELGDVVLLDIPQTENMPKGKALDLFQAGADHGFRLPPRRHDQLRRHGRQRRGGDHRRHSPQAGHEPRRPLEHQRQDRRARSPRKSARPAPTAVVIVVSNPLDAMVQRAWQVTGFPPQRVIGQAGVLDTARFRAFLAMELNVSVEDVSAHADGRPRRHDGAAGQLLLGGRHPGHEPRSARSGWSRSSSGRATAARRSFRLLKTGSAVLRPGRGHRADGRGDRPRQEAADPLRRLLRQGIRRRRLLRRRAGSAGQRRASSGSSRFQLSSGERAAFQKSVDAVKGLVETMARIAG